MKAVRLLSLIVFPLLLVAQQADLFKELRFRLVGPFRGGRVVAVAGVPSEPNVYYFGGVGGGVWKTIDSGASWLPISDAAFKTASVGAIAVADSDPNVIYAGMGEACVRGNATNGDGVYKSTDGGKTWRNVGLRDSYHIGAVRVHPRNADIVYVAALGHFGVPMPSAASTAPPMAATTGPISRAVRACPAACRRVRASVDRASRLSIPPAQNDDPWSVPPSVRAAPLPQRTGNR